MKTKILADFQICINVPLNSLNQNFYLVEKQTFYMKVLILIFILIFNEYFHAAKIKKEMCKKFKI